MRWKGRRRSSNIEDRRGARGRRGLIGGGIGTLVVLLFAAYTGVDPNLLLRGLESVSVQGGSPEPLPAELANDPGAEFTAVVLADTEEVWESVFASLGRRYEPPTLVLYTGSTRSACGLGQAAMGPFYCPADRRIYIDLGFFDELSRRFAAPGDFARAYVIAHEVAHHVQNLLGVSSEIRRQQQQAGNSAAANRLSVRLELQADCLAGVWAQRADRLHAIIEAGDVEEALNAASAIGDDRLQRQSGNVVAPDSFTHGTSEQRVRWFRAGLESGDPGSCDTFSNRAM